jgi:hypothetical protein
LELAFEIGLGSNDFLFGGSGDFLSGFSFLGGSFFALAIALAIAAGTIVFAGALAVAVALAVSAVIALAHQALCPSNDLVTVLDSNEHQTANSGESSQDLQNQVESFHLEFLLFNILLLTL